MAMMPNFPLVTGVDMFLPGDKVNPAYVGEVMKFVKYIEIDFKNQHDVNQVTVTAALPDGYPLATATSGNPVGKNLDVAWSFYDAKAKARWQAEQVLFNMLQVLLYFKLSGMAVVVDRGDFNGDIDEVVQAILRNRWGFGASEMLDIGVVITKYTNREAVLILNELGPADPDVAYGNGRLRIAMPTLPTSNAAVVTADEFDFIFDMKDEGIAAVQMRYYQKFINSSTRALVQRVLVQVIDCSEVPSSRKINQQCCDAEGEGEWPMPGGEGVIGEAIGAYITLVIKQIVERRMKDDLVGRYITPFAK